MAAINAKDYRAIEVLLADSISRIVDIDERTESNGLILQEFPGLASSIHSLTLNTASNTAAIATLNNTMQDVRYVMERFQEADQEKWNIATGKRHVPAFIFFLVTGTLCFVILAICFAWVGMDLKTAHFELRNSIEAAKDKPVKANGQ